MLRVDKLRETESRIEATMAGDGKITLSVWNDGKL